MRWFFLVLFLRETDLCLPPLCEGLADDAGPLILRGGGGGGGLRAGAGGGKDCCDANDDVRFGTNGGGLRNRVNDCSWLGIEGAGPDGGGRRIASPWISSYTNGFLAILAVIDVSLLK